MGGSAEQAGLRGPGLQAAGLTANGARLPLVQGSLLELLDGDGTGPAPGPLSPERTWLAHGAWVDVQRGWLAGSQELYDRLAACVPWRAERRQMYDRAVDVPRLQCFYAEGADLPEPALDTAREALSRHYAAELGEPFRTAGLCLYRDGRDSVAWHGDTIGRGKTQDTMVAIVSVGAPRALMLRPRGGGLRGFGPRGGGPRAGGPSGSPSGGGPSGGGPSGGSPSRGSTVLRHDLGHGDLIVMGGSCQRTWEHAIPKTAYSAHSACPTGPRISIQFRPRGVR
jgi:alkylated DNA repair dioxygenase AlkB